MQCRNKRSLNSKILTMDRPEISSDEILVVPFSLKSDS